MDVVLLATLAGVLFGALAVALRVALRRACDPEAGVFVCALLGFLVAAAVALPLAARGVETEGLWAFALVGAFVPGLSQIVFVRAIRDAAPRARPSSSAPRRSSRPASPSSSSTSRCGPRSSSRPSPSSSAAPCSCGSLRGRPTSAPWASCWPWWPPASSPSATTSWGNVTVAAPFNATQSLWGVLFAAAFIGRTEAVGPRLVAASALVVAGGVLIGVTR